VIKNKIYFDIKLDYPVSLRMIQLSAYFTYRKNSTLDLYLKKGIKALALFSTSLQLLASGNFKAWSSMVLDWKLEEVLRFAVGFEASRRCIGCKRCHCKTARAHVATDLGLGRTFCCFGAVGFSLGRLRHLQEEAADYFY
jgi:hypothetical protein